VGPSSAPGGLKPAAPPAPPEHPFAPKTAPLAVQEDAEATRVERSAISRNTLAPKAVVREKTLVGSLTPDDQPTSVFPLLDAESIIGRAPDCAITITDASISSRHARVVRSGEGFTIEDLGSRNGTFVNGEKVDKPRLLGDGDVVRVGKVIMTFNVAQETVAEPKTQMMSLE
ncbi:MAG TPA: FHA domain-containing protein, partial [Thermoanaerobaculia bacterium]|nr:FHA domain-containing protein [Thermoanaerobaculia bacterium]